MKNWLKRNTSQRQYELLRMLAYEYKRWRCRIAAPKRFETDQSKMHLGCGVRHIPGWLNIDLFDSDLNLDIASAHLPFKDAQFEAIVCQHVIEHLTIVDELIPLMRSCHRVMRSGGEFWISTPDMEKVARSYVNHKCEDMVQDRSTRLEHWSLGGMPSQQFLNNIFHQQLEHRNLFDEDLLRWTLSQAGFEHVERVDEARLLERFPSFPERKDDYQSIYVKAVKA